MKGRREKMWLLSSCLSQCETLHVNPFTLFQNDQKSHLIQCERAKRAMHIVRKSPKMSHLHFTIMAFLTCLVTLFDSKLHIFKNSPNWSSMAFLMNFWQVFMLLASLAILNETFSLIFKHCVEHLERSWEEDSELGHTLSPTCRPSDSRLQKSLVACQSLLLTLLRT